MSRVQGAAARMAAIVSPPIPAMATASASLGEISARPSHRQNLTFPSKPNSSTVALARFKGPGRRSAAMAL